MAAQTVASLIGQLIWWSQPASPETPIYLALPMLIAACYCYRDIISCMLVAPSSISICLCTFLGWLAGCWILNMDWIPSGNLLI